MLGLLAAVCAAGVSMSAWATPYNIAFNGGGWSAVGQVDVTSGLATGGYLDVTYGLVTVDYDYLAPVNPSTPPNLGVVVSNNNGDNLPLVDNLVDVHATYFVDEYGLLFLTAPDIGGHSSGAGIYLSADQSNGNVPNLNGYGNSPGFGWGNPNVDGTATVIMLPDGGSTAMLLSAGMLGLVILSRKTVYV